MLKLSSLLIFVSAFLLFWIQPLAAKRLLPYFGGTPVVWNVSMVFFQSMLLLGYFYVYVIWRYRHGRRQLCLHLIFIALCVGVLYAMQHSALPSLSSRPEWDILHYLVKTLFWPTLLLTVTAPLVQLWYAHGDQRDPYFLYAASNLGSMLACASFPLLLEPSIGLQQQTLYWFCCVTGVALLQAALAIKSNRLSESHVITTCYAGSDANSTAWLYWLVLTMLPSSLLLGVTQEITQEVGAVPILWIIPLMVFLASIIIAFQAKPIISEDRLIREYPLFILFPALLLSEPYFVNMLWVNVLFHCIGLFVMSLLCYQALVKRRPRVDRLPQFYLCIAAGGLLGGSFNTFVAPHVFSSIVEYPMALCGAIFVIHLARHDLRVTLNDMLFVSLVFVVLWFNQNYNDYYQIDALSHLYPWLKLLVFFFIFAAHKHALRFALSLFILLTFSFSEPIASDVKLIKAVRNPFGVSQVFRNDGLDLNILVSGSTIHGMELRNLSKPTEQALTYYRPVYDLFANKKAVDSPQQIAVFGLGIGVISCAFSQRDILTFFELDPGIIQIAEDGSLFSYLKRCPAKGGIVQGDARVEMGKYEGKFDVIILDAFSSDAVPTHLATIEAIKLYVSKLNDGGIILANISNRYVDLAPMFARHGKILGLDAFMLASDSRHGFDYASRWVALTRSQHMISELVVRRWQPIPYFKGTVWSDNYSNILSTIS